MLEEQLEADIKRQLTYGKRDLWLLSLKEVSISGLENAGIPIQ
jgi:hypothetical protein